MTLLHNMEPNSFLLSVLSLIKDEALLITNMAYIMIIMGVMVVFLLQFQKAAYGRYASSSWGFPVNGHLAWFLQELPSFAIPAYYFFFSGARMMSDPVNTALVILFLIHYIQRTFIFPYLIRGGKPTPVLVFLSAVFFCCYNGYMQGCWLAKFARYPDSYMYNLNFIIGVSMFASGMAINIHSDHVLRNLRKPGETGYKIPKGGMFEFVSGANFLGEIVEWSGFALASWSLPTLAFAIFTVCNIGPRALSHHQWYKEKFDDYPKNRKALIPFLL